MPADGEPVHVGLYQLQTGKIIWKGYDDILWAGKEGLFFVMSNMESKGW